MEITAIILEYLKVILTAPVLFAIIVGIFIFKFSEDIKSLLLRIAKIKLPNGIEVNTPQGTRITDDESKSPPIPESVTVEEIPTGLTTAQKQTTEDLIKSYIANTYLWEYRYLNYYLVRETQVALDWLVGLSQLTTYAHYDSFWLPLIPSAKERQASRGN